MKGKATQIHDKEIFKMDSNERGMFIFSRIKVKDGWIYLHESQSYALGNASSSMVIVPDNYDMKPEQ